MISDSMGSLKYYSNGCSIADNENKIVAGADTLNPGWWYDNWCNGWNGYPYGDQSMVFIPFEDDIYNLIYKYRNRQIIAPNVVADINDTIYLAALKQGELDYINNPIFNDTLSFGSLAAVKHANNTDYWIVTPHDSSDIYFSIHISADGVEDVNEQVVEGVWRRNHNGVIAKFAPDGTKYIGFEQTYLDQTIKVFSFDRPTGGLELLYTLTHPEGMTSLVGGIEFSPSGRYLYVSTRNFIYQYDLEAADLEGSKTVVAEYDGFADPFPCTFHVMQLGPDCRIYVNTSNSQQWLHVIMYPDRPGIECEVRQHHIPLFYYHQISMPYFPNYRLGTGEPVCDSTLSLPTSIPIVYVPEGGIRVWPNPARGQVWLGLSESLVREAAVLTLYDMMGRQVWQQDYTGGDAISIDLYSLSPGIYVLQVQGRDGRRWTEKLILE
jgi:WD40 repeat protein